MSANPSFYRFCAGLLDRPGAVLGRGAGRAAVAGWLLAAAGIALYSICAFWGFALRGKGTPAPIDPPKKLVAEGPYRIVRNPMYGSVVFVIVGEALAFRSVALAEIGCVFFAFTALFVILHEEPRLRNKFGAEYET